MRNEAISPSKKPKKLGSQFQPSEDPGEEFAWVADFAAKLELIKIVQVLNIISGETYHSITNEMINGK